MRAHILRHNHRLRASEKWHGLLLPTLSHFLILSKQFHQLRTYYSNMWALWDYSPSSHHTVWQQPFCRFGDSGEFKDHWIILRSWNFSPLAFSDTPSMAAQNALSYGQRNIGSTHHCQIKFSYGGTDLWTGRRNRQKPIAIELWHWADTTGKRTLSLKI